VDKKPLIDTNPYLAIPEEYRKSLITNVSTSTSIETGTSARAVAGFLLKSEDKIWLIEMKKSRGSSR